MNLDLVGKVAIVTGSSSGIGFGIASELAREGVTVILNGRNENKLKIAKNAIPGSFAIVADVSQKQQCDNLVKETVSRFGKLNILVTNVGDGKSLPPGSETAEERRRMIEVNLYSTTQMVDAALCQLRLNKGAIVSITSICGIESIGCPIAYSASKAAIESFVCNTSRLIGCDGVRINSVAPGNILFPGSVWEEKLKENREKVEAMLRLDVPMQRLGTVEDIGRVVTFLVSPAASFITGTCTVVDGGQTKS